MTYKTFDFLLDYL